MQVDQVHGVFTGGQHGAKVEFTCQQQWQHHAPGVVPGQFHEQFFEALGVGHLLEAGAQGPHVVHRHVHERGTLLAVVHHAEHGTVLGERKRLPPRQLHAQAARPAVGIARAVFELGVHVFHAGQLAPGFELGARGEHVAALGQLQGALGFGRRPGHVERHNGFAGEYRTRNRILQVQRVFVGHGHGGAGHLLEAHGQIGGFAQQVAGGAGADLIGQVELAGAEVAVQHFAQGVARTRTEGEGIGFHLYHLLAEGGGFDGVGGGGPHRGGELTSPVLGRKADQTALGRAVAHGRTPGVVKVDGDDRGVQALAQVLHAFAEHEHLAGARHGAFGEDAHHVPVGNLLTHALVEHLQVVAALTRRDGDHVQTREQRLEPFVVVHVLQHHKAHLTRHRGGHQQEVQVRGVVGHHQCTGIGRHVFQSTHAESEQSAGQTPCNQAHQWAEGLS